MFCLCDSSIASSLRHLYYIKKKIEKAREYYKGSKPNDEEGEKVEVTWKQIEGDDSTVLFSKSDMEKMKAKVGDLVYWLQFNTW